MPSLPPGMLVVLMVSCFLAGGYFLQPGRRKQRNTFLALLLFAIPLSIGALTLPFMLSNGTIADAQQVNANFLAVTGALEAPACPAGMTRLDLPHSTLCFDSGIQGTHDQTLGYCSEQFRVRLCTMAQWHDAICEAGIPSPGRSWTNDITGSGAFGTVAGCTGESVGSSAYVQVLSGPCCLEYPGY